MLLNQQYSCFALTSLSRWVLRIHTGSVMRCNATAGAPRSSRVEALMVVSRCVVEPHRSWWTDRTSSATVGSRIGRYSHGPCSEHRSCCRGRRGFHRTAVATGPSSWYCTSAVSTEHCVSCWSAWDVSLFIHMFLFAVYLTDSDWIGSNDMVINCWIGKGMKYCGCGQI